MVKDPRFACQVIVDEADEEDPTAWAKGTSVDMAIPAMLREELYVPEEPPFQNIPLGTEMNGVYRFRILMPPNTIYAGRMTEFV